MKGYQKVMLYAYPKLKRWTEDIGQMIRAKACASYRGRETAESCVEKLLEYQYAQNCFQSLKADLDTIFGALTEEELYLLEYKYFRRKKVLQSKFCDFRVDYSERTYFRRQKRLEIKLNALFLQRGMDIAWFERTLKPIPCMAAALEKIQSQGEREFVDKRARCELKVADSEHKTLSFFSALMGEKGNACAK